MRETAYRTDSMNYESPRQRRVVGRSTDRDWIVSWCHIPGIRLFGERLQDAVVDRNRDYFRFAGRKCNPRPSPQPLVRFVCALGKPSVDFGDLGSEPLPSVL